MWRRTRTVLLSRAARLLSSSLIPATTCLFFTTRFSGSTSKNYGWGGGWKFATARRECGQNNKNYKYEDTAVQYRTGVQTEVHGAQKLKFVPVATTRGRQQPDQNASGLCPRGLTGLSFFQRRPSLEPSIFFRKSQPGFLICLFLFRCPVL